MNPLNLNPHFDATNLDAGAAVPMLESLDEHMSEASAGDLIIVMMPLLGTALLIFLFWRLMRVVRTPAPTTAGYFRCPVTGRAVVAEFQLDRAGRRPVEVNWCSAFVPAVRVRCPKKCLRTGIVGGRRASSRQLL